MKILKKIIKNVAYLILAIIFLFFLVIFLFWLFKSPSNNRNWELGQEKNQFVKIVKDKVKIKDLRDFDWTKKKDGDKKNYKDFDFNISDIKNLEVGVSHFSTNEGIGHVFLIFNLEDGRNFALSIESRRDNGEDFSLIGGLIFNYEIIYILTTKEDLLSLREERNERVYVYPIKTDAQKIQQIFLLISQKVNSLYEKPEFYHLFFKNCTNLITNEVEKVSDKRFPIYEKTFAPGYSAKALFDMGLLDTNLKTFEEVNEKFLIRF